MRVNVYAEEMTDRIEIIGKEIDGHTFTGLRFYLELPVTQVLHTIGNHEHVESTETRQVQGPFMHRPGDDDSAAVTFWGKRDLRKMLRLALAKLDEHYGTGACICGDILRTNETRHFKECPLRATYPEPIPIGIPAFTCQVCKVTYPAGRPHSCTQCHTDDGKGKCHHGDLVKGERCGHCRDWVSP